MTTATIDILHCSACSAPIPLGDGEAAVCPFCKASTPIPAEQRALRDATRADSEQRARAVVLYREIGTPPSLALRLVGFASPTFLAVGGFAIVLLVGYVLFVKVGGAIGHAVFHAEILDVLSDHLLMIGPFAVAFVLGLIGLMLSAYARRRAISLRKIQVGLAARPPERAGGPTTCRACGGPLTVPADAYGVVCDYCRADNLLRVPTAWVASVTAGTHELAAAIDEAASAHRTEVDALRGRLRARLIVWAVIALIVFGVLGLGMSGVDPFAALDDWPPSWSADVRGDRPMHAHRSRVDRIDQPIHPDKGISPRCDGPWLDPHQGAWSSAAACDASGCRFRWIVALRHGERLMFHTTDVTAQLHFYRHDPGGRFEDRDFVEQADAALAPDTTPTFEATRSAWYAVGVTITGMVPNEGRSLCVQLR